MQMLLLSVQNTIEILRTHKSVAAFANTNECAFTSTELMNFKKIHIDFQKRDCSGIIPFVYEGKEEIHKYMQYEV